MSNTKSFLIGYHFLTKQIATLIWSQQPIRMIKLGGKSQLGWLGRMRKYHLVTPTQVILQLVKTLFHLVEDMKISAEDLDNKIKSAVSAKMWSFLNFDMTSLMMIPQYYKSICCDCYASIGNWNELIWYSIKKI
jgi:hypothetical protein